jgi:hypothetical protein
MIKIDEIESARSAFETNEPRDLFYRAATELVGLAIEERTSLSVADALAVLLQTWNKAYYRYHKFDKVHFEKIASLYHNYRELLGSYRNATIGNLNDGEKTVVSNLFRDFEIVLGPVGAAKTLHLLAPRLFPLWDRAIAKAYGVPLGTTGTNGERYWRFITITRRQYLELKSQLRDCGNILKRIDEYNYCKFTKGWPLTNEAQPVARRAD